MLNVIFRTGPRATYVVLSGDSVPADTTLVTPAIEYIGGSNVQAWGAQPHSAGPAFIAASEQTDCVQQQDSYLVAYKNKFTTLEIRIMCV